MPPFWRAKSCWKTFGEFTAPKPADDRRLSRLSVSLDQHLRIGEREEREHRAPVRLQRLFGDAIPAGIAPIEPEAGGDALGPCAFNGSEEYREGRRRWIKVLPREPIVRDADGTLEPPAA